MLLLRNKRRMDPFGSNPAVSLRLRNADPALAPLKFLFEPYTVEFYYFEVGHRCVPLPQSPLTPRGSLSTSFSIVYFGRRKKEEG